MLINCLVIVYLLFTREFDNNSYYLIYTKKRKKIVIKKFLTSLLMIVSVFMVYIGIILIIGSFFDKKFNYVLIFSEEKPFYINTAKYIFSDIVMFVFYLSIFFNILFFSIALIFKKSYSSVLFFIGIIAIVFILGTLKCNIIPYLGLAVDYSVIDYKYRLLVKLPILLTVLLFVFSLYKFEHSDL